MPDTEPSQLVTEVFPPWDQVDTVNSMFRVRYFAVAATSDEQARAHLANQKFVRRGSIYQNYKGEVVDSLLLCQSISVRGKIGAPPDGWGLYEVTAVYAFPDVGYLPPTYGTGPRYRIEAGTEVRPADFDRFGNKITNTLGEPIDPPLARAVVAETFVADFMALGTDWWTIRNFYRTFNGRVNSDTYFGYPPHCLYMEPIIIGETNTQWGETGKFLYRVTARMPYRPLYDAHSEHDVPGYHDAYINRSNWYKELVGGVVEKIHAPSPVEVNVEGWPMALDEDGFPKSSDDPIILITEHYNDIDFAGLIP